MEGNISDAVEVLPLSHPDASFPAITICPTYGAAYNKSHLKVMYWVATQDAKKDIKGNYRANGLNVVQEMA